MRPPIFFLVLTSLAACAPLADPKVELPLKEKSVRFAVIGDNGTGKRGEYDIAQQMVKCREKFPFDFVVMLGDNIYGGESAADFQLKFETPYKQLLDAGVKFYASLGNHDSPNQRFYKPFNMGEKRYYSFKKENAEFFALDSTYMDAAQLSWIGSKLEASKAAWKICYFHHPLYSDGKFHGPDVDLRTQIEPMFMDHGVNVVLSGHEHVYERIKPQKGIHYFVLGSSGQLRVSNLRPSPILAKGFDKDRTFMLVEIAGDELYFQTISRTGDTVDSGMFDKSGGITEATSRYSR